MALAIGLFAVGGLLRLSWRKRGVRLWGCGLAHSPALSPASRGLLSSSGLLGIRPPPAQVRFVLDCAFYMEPAPRVRASVWGTDCLLPMPLHGAPAARRAELALSPCDADRASPVRASVRGTDHTHAGIARALKLLLYGGIARRLKLPL